MCSDEVGDLAAAAAEHRALMGRPDVADERSERRPTGETSRLKELRGKPGWSWLRVFRRYDDYSAALAQLESEEKAAAAAPERARELA
jgi:hypothetical protein